MGWGKRQFLESEGKENSSRAFSLKSGRSDGRGKIAQNYADIADCLLLKSPIAGC